MNIKQNQLPKNKYPLKSPHLMTPVGICVHNTANDASAKNEISYMVSNNLQTSFHFAVDDKEVWQGLPLDRNGWHAGDGNGDGNRKHIGVEICYSKSGGERFDKAEARGAALVAHLLQERGWGIERVKKHQDFSGKYCPHRTLDLGWERFLELVKKHLPADTIPPVEMLPKDSIIRDVYRGLTGKSPSQGTVNWRLEQGKNIRELVEDIAQNDGGFYDKWVAPRVKEIQAELSILQKAFNENLTRVLKSEQDRDAAERAYRTATEEYSDAIAKLRLEMEELKRKEFVNPIARFLVSLAMFFERSGD